MASAAEFITHISRSLGRTSPPTTAPAAPVVDESIARLVQPTDDLVARFTTAAEAAKLHVSSTTPADLVRLLTPLCANRRMVITPCELCDRLGLADALRSAGAQIQSAQEAGKPRMYEADIGLTDVYAAVAETGSIVVRRSASHPLMASLVPPVHIAVVERNQIVPDLIDLMRKLNVEGTAGGVTIITGPSKTADIEMNLVTGVHGPGEVHVFVI